MNAALRVLIKNLSKWHCCRQARVFLLAAVMTQCLIRGGFVAEGNSKSHLPR